MASGSVVHSVGSAPRRPAASRAVLPLEGPFVGREDEMRRLSAALTLAVEGRGRAVFLTGEPGIGKTRLAMEALALANERGFTALEGRAHPLEIGLAYAPILGAFSPLLRDVGSARLAALTSDLPHLGRLFTGLRLPAPEPLGDPALERTCLFEAVSRLIERLARRAPVALFVDDLHWADPATLQMLHYVARGLSGQRVLLLGTYGPGTLGIYRDLSALVRSMERTGLAEEIVVPSLGPAEVDTLLQQLLGGEVPGDLLALLDSRAGGTPLYIEALVIALLEAGNLVHTDHEWKVNAEAASPLPPSVRRLVLERLERLMPEDRRILGLIAIMGEAAPHIILRATSGLRESALLQVLRRLRAAGLVAEGMDGTDVAYHLTHPLIQEVAYSELPEVERRDAHLAAIHALERLRPDDLSRLAHHYRGAGPEAQPGRALQVLLAAAERARTLYANEEAARHYSSALAMVREGGHQAAITGYDEPLLPWLLERLGDAWGQIGDYAPAIAAWEESLAERERFGDAVGVSCLRGRLSQAEAARDHIDAAMAHLGAGLAALAGHGPCQELVDLYFAQCSLLYKLGDIVALAEKVKELLFVTKKLGSPQAEAKASLVASRYNISLGELAISRERAAHALVIGERAQELAICCRSHSVLAFVSMGLGDHKSTRCHAEAGLTLAQRLGAPHLEICMRPRLARAHFMAGAWDESWRESLTAISLARRMGHPRDLAYSLAERALVLAFQGDLCEAEACIAEARTALYSLRQVDRQVLSAVEFVEATTAIEMGQAERALGIAKGFDCSSTLADGRPSVIPVAMAAGLMLLAEAQVAAGDPQSALKTARKLTGLSTNSTPYVAALFARAEGLAMRDLGQEAAAMDCLARAQEAFTLLEIPFEAARSALDRGTSAGIAHPQVAIDAVRLSLITFERLGARRYADRARELLQRLGCSPPATSQTRPGGVRLSGRELEISRLIAGGLTTAEIADRLTISRRTVSTHLDHIYTRLGINSRAVLARYVVETGLLFCEGENT